MRFIGSKRPFLLAIIFVLLLVAGGGAWTLLLRPVSVKVAQPEKNVVVQVFGLGTV